MSIVHVVDRVKAGHGRGLSALAIAEAQHQSGWDVRLLVSGVRCRDLLCGRPPHEALLGDPAVDIYRNVDAIDRVASALAKHTRAGDTVVSHGGVDLAAACRFVDRRVVAAVHSDPADCLGYLPVQELDLVSRRTDHWIAWGTGVATRLRRLLLIDPARITVSAQAAELGRGTTHWLGGSPACLSVARVHPVKNHVLMLRALAVLRRTWPEVHWHMAGGCDDEGYLDWLSAVSIELGVHDQVTWHGHRKDATAMMQGADVTVLTSHSEGVPRAIQEAMVLGVPTVMPALLAVDLRHAGLPVTYASQRPGALARAIGAALRIDCHQLARASRWVTRRWGWHTVLEDWVSVCGT
jgi:hypothetical protein